jgi:hypothetical protein
MTTTSMADVRPSDLAIAVILAATVLIGSGLALAHARKHEPSLRDIDPGLGIPIAVRPVADLSSAGSGTSSADKQPVVPRAWRRKVPRAKSPAIQPEPQAHVPAPKKQPSKSSPSTVPDDAVAIDPDPIEPVEPTPEDPSTEPETPDETPESAEPDTAEPEPTEPDTAEPTEPTEPDTAEPTEPVEPNTAESDTAEPDTPEPDATPEGAEPDGESAGENSGETPTEGDGGSGGGTDPLLERAIAFYRARLVAWFSARFRVTGSGLSASELAKYRVRVHIDLGEDLRIVDYRILSSDHPAFEKAARSTLDKLRGEKLPPPPENFPGAVQRQLTVTFTCAEDTCD